MLSPPSSEGGQKIGCLTTGHLADFGMPEISRPGSVLEKRNGVVVGEESC